MFTIGATEGRAGTGAEPPFDAAILDDALLRHSDPDRARAVFIMGAPRTGSTVLYQAMINAFGFPFISNLVNTCFASTPIIGIAIQSHVDVVVGFESAFGKTEGAFQPSEGSAVMTHWFGGGHPSETLSAGILAGREAHFLKTLAAAEAIWGAPLLIKNAWNCFRIRDLAEAISKASFIWIRRDIRDAALSDLEARYLTKGNPFAWNSATPANYLELLQRPPPEQVVENQFAFNEAISSALGRHARGRSLEVWYEDLVAEPHTVLARIGSFVAVPQGVQAPARINSRDARLRSAVSAIEAQQLHDYVQSRPERFSSHTYLSRKDPE